MIESVGNYFSNALSSAQQDSSARSLSESPSHSPSTEKAQAAYASVSHARAETFSLEVKTQEGDTVTLSFAASQASSMSVSAATASNSNGSASAVQSSYSRIEQSSFEFSVEGDLNEEELTALTKMMDELGKMAESFYSGDVQAAFEQAAEYQMDREQFSAMALRMTQSEAVSATSAYAQVEGYGEKGETTRGAQQIGAMLDTLDKQTEEPTLSFLDNVKTLQETILDSLVKHHPDYAEDKETADQQLNQLNALREV